MQSDLFPSQPAEGTLAQVGEMIRVFKDGKWQVLCTAAALSEYLKNASSYPFGMPPDDRSPLQKS